MRQLLFTELGKVRVCCCYVKFVGRNTHNDTASTLNLTQFAADLKSNLLQLREYVKRHV